jgi:hypothetical protein
MRNAPSAQEPRHIARGSASGRSLREKPRTKGFSSERNEGRPRETALAEERNDALRPGAAPPFFGVQTFPL